MLLGFVEHLDTPQIGMVTVAAGQLLEHVEGEVDVLRSSVPFADAAQAAAVAAVLAVRHRVQVEEHRDSVTLSPSSVHRWASSSAEVPANSAGVIHFSSTSQPPRLTPRITGGRRSSNRTPP